MEKVQIGKIYKHFKGHKYKVILVCINSETLEEMVAYENIATKEVWVRPLKMFFQNVNLNGKLVKRFEIINE